jgi:hypothetical protein
MYTIIHHKDGGTTHRALRIQHPVLLGRGGHDLLLRLIELAQNPNHSTIPVFSSSDSTKLERGKVNP